MGTPLSVALWGLFAVVCLLIGDLSPERENIIAERITVGKVV